MQRKKKYIHRDYKEFYTNFVYQLALCTWLTSEHQKKEVEHGKHAALLKQIKTNQQKKVNVENTVYL